MAKPLIAIDVDDVLAEHNAGLANWHNKNFGTTHTAESYFSEWWADVWQISPELAEQRAQAFHEAREHRNLRPVPGAVAALKTLKQSYDLVVITVRRQLIIDDTAAWLNRHFPELFTAVRFIHFWDAKQKTTKAEMCQALGARYFIDDSVKHCLQTAEMGIPTLLFGDRSWNQLPALPPGVQRVNNWPEATTLLTKAEARQHR